VLNFVENRAQEGFVDVVQLIRSVYPSFFSVHFVNIIFFWDIAPCNFVQVD
jgi:hypothetical protein